MIDWKPEDLRINLQESLVETTKEEQNQYSQVEKDYQIDFGL